jgi:hypothetical protein
VALRITEGPPKQYEAVCKSCRLWTSGAFSTEEELLEAYVGKGDTKIAAQRASLNFLSYLSEMSEAGLLDVRRRCQQQIDHIHLLAKQLVHQCPRAVFSCDDAHEVYGYEMPGHWNGWARPAFTTDAALLYLTEIKVHFTYNPFKQEITVHTDPNSEGEDEVWGIRPITTVDGTLLLYDIGADSWTWDKVKDGWVSP